MANHAAYAKADVDDARRGHPASDLNGYAAARGLEPLGQALVGHFSGLNPIWPDYVFNVCRGELVPGRFGVVQHELREVSLGDDGDPVGGGVWFGRRSVAKPGLRSLVGLRKEPKNEPFAAQAMWVPTTTVKVLVPEAAVLPRIVILSKDHAAMLNPSLDPWAPSYRMSKSQFIADDLQTAIAGYVGPTLQSLGDPFVRFELKNGAIGLQANGFRSDPADLDRLVAAAGALAAAVVEIARPWWVPGPFEAPLGAFDRSTHPAGYVSFEGEMDRSGLDVLDRDAPGLGMVVEDPVALHRRFPRLALPGASRGVMAGTFPGTATFGRLSWQNQGHPASSYWFRRAAVIETSPDAQPTPVGGVLVPETDMYVAVGDGLACCWTRTNSEGKVEAADLVEQATTTFRARGLL